MIPDLVVYVGWAVLGMGAYVIPRLMCAFEPKRTPKTEAQIITDGWKALERMQKDVHALYHPKGCKCAVCEIQADDEPKPEPERKPGEVDKFVKVSPSYVRALQEKIDGLRKENTELRKGSRERVVTKTVERKTQFQHKLEQAAKFADQDQHPIKLTGEIDGHAIEVTVAPARKPDVEIYKHGEPEPVRKIWYPTGPTYRPLYDGFVRDPEETDREAMQRLAEHSRAQLRGEA